MIRRAAAAREESMPVEPRDANKPNRNAPRGSLPIRFNALAVAIAAGFGWTWAVTLLALRQHLTGDYDVIPDVVPLWGNLGLSTPALLLALAAGAILAAACGFSARETGRLWAPPTRWLMCCWLIPGLDLCRLIGVSISETFLEPLLLAAVTGAAAGAAVAVLRNAERAVQQPPSHRSVPWIAVVWTLAVLCAAWWYHQGQRFYDDYLLGYNDFGHFGFRVANTWEGRGFLLETPGLPAFWDHFNPGLALLAPLWGIWPDPRLFILIQAVCLAMPAPLVYGIARRLGADPRTSACWAAAYLMFPAVAQLNLNYTYGWHPVSLALPLIFLTIWALLRGWRTLALAAALLACSFQEDIIAVLSCLALSLAFQAWLGRHRQAARTCGACGTLRLPSDAMPPWAWGAVTAALAAAFVVVFSFTPISKFQSSRFSALGSSAGEILLSPVLRPADFWGTVLRPRCGLFLLCLTIPLGLRALLAGWTMLLAAALPLGVLLAWTYIAATSIAFQYTTALIPILFLAAMVGAVKLAERKPASSETAATANRIRSHRRAAVTALAASATASIVFGALPWSSPTLTGVIALTYREPGVGEDRVVGSPGNALLNQIVTKVGSRRSSVLATGRIAAHLLAVQRLDTVGQACQRWKAFQEEVGPERSPIELFDWVVLDSEEQFYQSPDELDFVRNAAKRAGYLLVESEHGVCVFGRPLLAPLWHGDLSRAERIGKRLMPASFGWRSQAGVDARAW
jgi:uncharacterized membrane protein